MGVVRPTQVETIYINSYYIYDSQTNQETRQTSHPIKISSVYYNTSMATGDATSWKYLIFKLNDSANQSQYKNKYLLKDAKNLSVYITGYSPREVTTYPVPPYNTFISRYSSISEYSSKSTPASTYGASDVGLDDESSKLLGARSVSIDSGNFSSKYLAATLRDNANFSGGYYKGEVSLTITGPGQGSNSPKVQLYWERCDPDIQTVNPGTGSYINAKSDTTISVLFEVLTSESGIEYPPTEISLLWGTSSSALNNTITGYPTEGNPRSAEIIVNANTFPNKTAVYFKIRYKSNAGTEYFESDVYNYITNDVVGTVSNLSPNNATINGEESNVFTWEYSSASGLGQTAFDLQISNNKGISWIDLFTKEISTETKANIPANTFYSGSALWKVRGYNASDEPSEWSEPANIIVLAPPRPPTIREITNTPKIKISWASGDQQAFQVIANDIDSGVVFGTKNIYYVPYYFKDNTVVNVKIRIKNKFGEWSGWATGTVTVKNIPTGEIDLIVSSNNDSANLNWSSDTEFISFYVLRGGIPIAKTADFKEYTDYTSVGANEYQITGITADGYYTVSNVVPVSVFPKTAVIGILSNAVIWVTLTYRRGNLPEIITSLSEDIYYQHYSGRTLPVAYSSRFKTKKKTLNFTVYKQDADAIENMTGQTVIYKDYADNKIIGIVNNVETSSNATRPDVKMEITAIDYLEDVGYD